MTLKEYKEQPFKYDGDCKPVAIAEVWDTLDRKTRREIERLVKKGKNPDILNYL